MGTCCSEPLTVTIDQVNKLHIDGLAMQILASRPIGEAALYIAKDLTYHGIPFSDTFWEKVVKDPRIIAEISPPDVPTNNSNNTEIVIEPLYDLNETMQNLVLQANAETLQECEQQGLVDAILFEENNVNNNSDSPTAAATIRGGNNNTTYEEKRKAVMTKLKFECERAVLDAIVDLLEANKTSILACRNDVARDETPDPETVGLGKEWSYHESSGYWWSEEHQLYYCVESQEYFDPFSEKFCGVDGVWYSKEENGKNGEGEGEEEYDEKFHTNNRNILHITSPTKILPPPTSPTSPFSNTTTRQRTTSILKSPNQTLSSSVSGQQNEASITFDSPSTAAKKSVKFGGQDTKYISPREQVKKSQDNYNYKYDPSSVGLSNDYQYTGEGSWWYSSKQDLLYDVDSGNYYDEKSNSYYHPSRGEWVTKD